jgi:peptidyl-prolyl cis-trans isomerase C
LLGLCLLTSGALAQGVYPGIAARVNGVEISNEALQRNYREYLVQNNVNIVSARSPERLEQLRRETLDLLVEQELAWQAAEKAGTLASDEEVEQALDDLRGQFQDRDAYTRRLANEGYTEESYRAHLRRLGSAQKYLDGVREAAGKVSDEELQQFYDDNKIRLTFPERVRARHILLTWKPLGTQDDRAELRERMKPILEQARSGVDFAELARKHSEDSSASVGGDLDFFGRGEMVKPFEDVAFALKPGEVSDLVETSFGVHILKVEERKDAELLPLDEVRDKLRAYVSQQKAEQAVRDHLVRLREDAKVEILMAQ